MNHAMAYHKIASHIYDIVEVRYDGKRECSILTKRITKGKYLKVIKDENFDYGSRLIIFKITTSDLILINCVRWSAIRHFEKKDIMPEQVTDIAKIYDNEDELKVIVESLKALPLPTLNNPLIIPI